MGDSKHTTKGLYTKETKGEVVVTAEEKKMRQAVLRGAQLMIDNGLGDWTVKLSNTRKSLADTNSHRKTIRYSKHFLRVTDKATFDGVTMHEIAHALVGAGHGHDNVFKAKVREIDPVNCFDDMVVPNEVKISVYRLECPECGTEGGCNRKRTGICANCYKEGKKVDMVLKKNPLKLVSW